MTTKAQRFARQTRCAAMMKPGVAPALAVCPVPEPEMVAALVRVSRRSRVKRSSARRFIHLLFDLQGGACWLCGEAMNFEPKREDGTLHPRRATVDHVTPVHLGGTNELANLRAACNGCNNERGGQALAREPAPVAPPHMLHPRQRAPHRRVGRIRP